MLHSQVQDSELAHGLAAIHANLILKFWFLFLHFKIFGLKIIIDGLPMIFALLMIFALTGSNPKIFKDFTFRGVSDTKT